MRTVVKRKNTCNTMSIVNTLGYLGGIILNIKLIKLCKIRPFSWGLFSTFCFVQALAQILNILPQEIKKNNI